MYRCAVLATHSPNPAERLQGDAFFLGFSVEKVKTFVSVALFFVFNASVCDLASLKTHNSSACREVPLLLAGFRGHQVMVRGNGVEICAGGREEAVTAVTQ